MIDSITPSAVEAVVVTPDGKHAHGADTARILDLHHAVISWEIVYRHRAGSATAGVLAQAAEPGEIDCNVLQAREQRLRLAGESLPWVEVSVRRVHRTWTHHPPTLSLAMSTCMRVNVRMCVRACGCVHVNPK